MYPKPVINLSKLPDKIRVSITDSHIKRGARRSYWKCPIALAIKDRLGIFNISDVIVGGDVIIRLDIGEHTDKYKYNLSLNAQRFINSFDEHGIGKPFNTILTLKS